LRALLRPFEPLVLSWSGRGDLATLQQAERIGTGVVLTGAGLAAGFYVNELLIRLLQRRDAHPVLFAGYSALLEELTHNDRIEPALRQFEMQLLEELGLGLNFAASALDGTALVAGQSYEYHLERGVVPVEEPDEAALVFSGEVLSAIHRNDWAVPGALRAAKRLLRHTIDYYLDGRELKTRRVYAAMLAGQSHTQSQDSDEDKE
jgi:DNA repair protein RecO (recombination protein O)